MNVLVFWVVGVIGNIMLVCLVIVLCCSFRLIMKLVVFNVVSMVFGLVKFVGLIFLISSVVNVLLVVVVRMLLVFCLVVVGNLVICYVVYICVWVILLVSGWLLGNSVGNVLVFSVLCFFVCCGIYVKWVLVVLVS